VVVGQPSSAMRDKIFSAIIIIIGSAALGGPWPTQANITSILCIRQLISTTQFLCVFLYPLNPS